MNKLLTFAFIAFLCYIAEANDKIKQGALEWPFYIDDEEDLYVDVKIGNPQQEIQVSLYYFHQNRDLVLIPKYSGKEFYGGQFDTNASKTLLNMGGDIYSADGELIGTNMYDDFEIANRTFISMRFIVEDHIPEFEFSAFLGFGIPNYEYSSFWSSFYNDLPEKIITIAYNNYPRNGVLVAGEVAKKYCHDDWTILPQKYWYYKQKKHDFDMPRAGLGPTYEAYQSFGVEVNQIVIGTAKFNNLKAKAFFKLNDDEIRWPSKLYSDILIHGLGFKDNKTISCESKENIKFAVNNTDSFIELTPEMYLEKEGQGKDAKCTLIGEVVEESDEFSIPRSFFSKNCLSISPYDQEIGIAPLREKAVPTTILPPTTRLPSNKQRHTKLGGHENGSNKLQIGQFSLLFLLGVKLIFV